MPLGVGSDTGRSGEGRRGPRNDTIATIDNFLYRTPSSSPVRRGPGEDRNQAMPRPRRLDTRRIDSLRRAIGSTSRTCTKLQPHQRPPLHDSAVSKELRTPITLLNRFDTRILEYPPPLLVRERAAIVPSLQGMQSFKILQPRPRLLPECPTKMLSLIDKPQTCPDVLVVRSSVRLS